MSPLDGLRRKVKSSSESTLRQWGQEVLNLLTSDNLILRTRASAALDMLPVKLVEFERT